MCALTRGRARRRGRSRRGLVLQQHFSWTGIDEPFRSGETAQVFGPVNAKSARTGPVLGEVERSAAVVLGGLAADDEEAAAGGDEGGTVPVAVSADDGEAVVGEEGGELLGEVEAEGFVPDFGVFFGAVVPAFVGGEAEDLGDGVVGLGEGFADLVAVGGGVGLPRELLVAGFEEGEEAAVLAGLFDARF